MHDTNNLWRREGVDGDKIYRFSRLDIQYRAKSGIDDVLAGSESSKFSKKGVGDSIKRLTWSVITE